MNVIIQQKALSCKGENLKVNWSADHVNQFRLYNNNWPFRIFYFFFWLRRPRRLLSAAGEGDGMSEYEIVRRPTKMVFFLLLLTQWILTNSLYTFFPLPMSFFRFRTKLCSHKSPVPRSEVQRRDDTGFERTEEGNSNFIYGMKK